MHRDPTEADFIGKRIIAVDASCINIWRFMFDDGTKLAVEVESFGNGLMGMVVCDACADAIDTDDTD